MATKSPAETSWVILFILKLGIYIAYVFGFISIFIHKIPSNDFFNLIFIDKIITFYSAYDDNNSIIIYHIFALLVDNMKLSSLDKNG